jgi:hypothetical protein
MSGHDIRLGNHRAAMHAVLDGAQALEQLNIPGPLLDELLIDL